MPVAQAKSNLEALSDRERDLYLGERMIGRQGCFGCHLIQGFESAQLIGTELTLEGSKDVDKLDFALNPTDIDHTNYDWFFTKIKHPRIFDEGKVKLFDEKLRMPNFGLSDDDAHAITTALLSYSRSFVGSEARKHLSPHDVEIEKGRRIVYERNCRGCHVIEGKGGAIRDVLAKAYVAEGVGEAEAVGFAPPILNGQGSKVQPDWFFRFLKEIDPIRPWLSVRMPTFDFDDQNAIDVVTYFSRLEDQPFPYRTFVEKRLGSGDIRGATQLFSPDIFNCWTCHQKGDINPKGDPASWAPDLTLARERLKPEWIRSWLWDPQKILPGTKMPTFFGDEMAYLPEDMAQYLKLPEGTKPEDGILLVPTDTVIEALTDYMIYGLHQGVQISQR